MDGKKIALAVGLIVVIAFAVWLIARNTGSGGGPDIDKVKATKVKLVDENPPYDVIEKTLGEWEKDGKKDGKYKNPTTGEYTMVPFMTCMACGAQIPAVTPPPEAKTNPINLGKWQATITCPKCGKSPFAGPGTRTPPMPQQLGPKGKGGTSTTGGIPGKPPAPKTR